MSDTFAVASTDSAEPAEKLQQWQDICEGIFGPPSCTVYSTPSFHGRIECDTLGPMKLCKLSVGPHKVVRNAQTVSKTGGDFWKVVLQVKGSVRFEHPAKSIQLLSGEWSLYDSAIPCSVTNTEDEHQLILMFPKQELILQTREVLNAPIYKFSGFFGMGKLAYDFIRSTFDTLPVIPAGWERDVIDTITRLIRLAVLQAADDHATVPGPETFSQRIKTYIGRHLKDPDLSIDEIAKSFHCTKRYLHKAFEDQGLSISSYIWQIRLDRCKQDLANPARVADSIRDIALGWGFKSPTHFSKAFKDAYGVVPRAMRLTPPQSFDTGN